VSWELRNGNELVQQNRGGAPGSGSSMCKWPGVRSSEVCSKCRGDRIEGGFQKEVGEGH
jgi:hypothetical protein